MCWGCCTVWLIGLFWSVVGPWLGGEGNPASQGGGGGGVAPPPCLTGNKIDSNKSFIHTYKPDRSSLERFLGQTRNKRKRMARVFETDKSSDRSDGSLSSRPSYESPSDQLTNQKTNDQTDHYVLFIRFISLMIWWYLFIYLPNQLIPFPANLHPLLAHFALGCSFWCQGFNLIKCTIILKFLGA